MRAFLFGKNVEADLLKFPAVWPLDGSIRVRATAREAAMILEGLMKKSVVAEAFGVCKFAFCEIGGFAS